MTTRYNFTLVRATRHLVYTSAMIYFHPALYVCLFISVCLLFVQQVYRENELNQFQ